jgi:hypothetical protein
LHGKTSPIVEQRPTKLSILESEVAMPGFVQIAVPEDRVLDVYAFLLGKDQNGATWTPDLLERMYLESPKPIQQLLVTLAKRAGTVHTDEELAEAVGRSRTQLAGVLGAYGRRVKNRYGMEQWPFETIYDDAAGMYSYVIPDDDTARTLLEVAGLAEWRR